MNVYFKENIGIQTPQGHDLNYFVIIRIGNNFETGTNTATINFYLFEGDAKENKPANAQRTCEWVPMLTDTDAIRQNLFSLDSIETTSQDVITLKNPTII